MDRQELERLSRTELAEYLTRCRRNSAQWRRAMEIGRERLARIARMERYAGLSILACAALILVASLLP